MNKTIAAFIFLLAAAPVAASENYNYVTVQGTLDSTANISGVKVDVVANGSVVGSSDTVDLQPDANGFFTVSVHNVDPSLLVTSNTEYELVFSTGNGAYEVLRLPLTSVPFAKALKGPAGTDNLIAAKGNVGIGTTAPAYKLDVTGDAHFTSSVTASKFYGDGSALTGITASGDNLGNHIATTTLQMAGNNIYNASTITTTGDISAARYQIAGTNVLRIWPGKGTLAVGENAGGEDGGSGSSNTYVGTLAGYFVPSGWGNTFVGAGSGTFSYGYDNTFIGWQSGQANRSGIHNTFVGTDSGIANYTADYNTYVGESAGFFNQDGNSNAFFGNYAGYEIDGGSQNTLLGAFVGGGLVSGSNNIIVGYAQAASAPSASNELNLGGVLFGNLSDKTIGISRRAPQAALDVVSTGTAHSQFAQIWRASDGVVKASMSATGLMMATKFVGDGSGLSGISASSGDNLGNHIATTTLNMSGFNIASANLIAVSLLRFADNNIVISSAPSSQGGGIYTSTNMYVNGDLYAAKIYGDVSGATGFPAGDNLGNHTATLDLSMANFNIGGANLVSGASALFSNGVTAASFTATGAALGVDTAKLRFTDSNIVLSSASPSQYGGLYASTHVYVNGDLYGNGAALTTLNCSVPRT